MGHSRGECPRNNTNQSFASVVKDINVPDSVPVPSPPLAIPSFSRAGYKVRKVHMHKTDPACCTYAVRAKWNGKRDILMIDFFYRGWRERRPLH